MTGTGPVYLGRWQQGRELPLALQCHDATGAPADPADVPTVAVYRDGASPTFVEQRRMAADLRGVQAGAFRLGLYLGQSYATAGRYTLLFRWADAAGTAHLKVGVLTLSAGGSADGAVIALRYVERPDSRYLVYQTDSGRLIRGRNPR